MALQAPDEAFRQENWKTEEDLRKELIANDQSCFKLCTYCCLLLLIILIPLAVFITIGLLPVIISSAESESGGDLYVYDDDWQSAGYGDDQNNNSRAYIKQMSEERDRTSYNYTHRRYHIRHRHRNYDDGMDDTSPKKPKDIDYGPIRSDSSDVEFPDIDPDTIDYRDPFSDDGTDIDGDTQGRSRSEVRRGKSNLLMPHLAPQPPPQSRPPIPPRRRRPSSYRSSRWSSGRSSIRIGGFRRG